MQKRPHRIVSVLYNEFDAYPAAWLRNLARAGHIAPGVVDDRSIEALTPDDVRGRKQFHAFAGIGAWSYALRLAGWPDDREVWTGSCPCQPFSVAGKGRGTADERHLWPEWFRLIRECRPPVVFGEQVASGDGLAWLDVVCADLEAEGYAVGAADLCAAGVGAPHIRQRLFFGAVRVADAVVRGRASVLNARSGDAEDSGGEGNGKSSSGDLRGPVRGGEPLGVADAERVDGLREHRHGVGGAARGDQGQGHQQQRLRAHSADGGATGDVDDAVGAGLEGRRYGHPAEGGWVGTVRSVATAGESRLFDAWARPDWLPCRDGKARPVEPGTFPLAHGAPARVGRLRAYGNAIVPQVAAGFVRAFMEATS